MTEYNYLLITNLSGDWEALYDQNKALCQGHSISIKDLIDHGVVLTELEIRDATVSESQQCDDEGQFPSSRNNLRWIEEQNKGA